MKHAHVRPAMNAASLYVHAASHDPALYKYTKHRCLIMPNGISATAPLKNVAVFNAGQPVSLSQAHLLRLTFLQASEDTFQV